MKAVVVTEPGKIEVREISTPRPNPYQALVRMDIVGVCSATDRKLVYAIKPFAPAYPALLGHEGVGTIVETGAGVRNYNVGDRVLRPCGLYPGEMVEGVSSAWGSLCEFGLVTDVEAWRAAEPEGEHSRFSYSRMQKIVPVNWTAEQACLLITWKETYSSLTQAGEIAGKDIAVWGDGAVGLSFVAWSRALGAASISVIGRRKFRLERARALGATATCNLRGDEEFVGGRDFDLVVDTLGSDENIAKSLPRLRPSGVFTVYGTDSFKTSFDRSHGPASWSYVQASPDEGGVHDKVLDLLGTTPFDSNEWITFRGGIDDLPAAFAHLETPESLKAIITFS